MKTEWKEYNTFNIDWATDIVKMYVKIYRTFREAMNNIISCILNMHYINQGVGSVFYNRWNLKIISDSFWFFILLRFVQATCF